MEVVRVELAVGGGGGDGSYSACEHMLLLCFQSVLELDRAIFRSMSEKRISMHALKQRFSCHALIIPLQAVGQVLDAAGSCAVSIARASCLVKVMLKESSWCSRALSISSTRAQSLRSECIALLVQPICCVPRHSRAYFYRRRTCYSTSLEFKACHVWIVIKNAHEHTSGCFHTLHLWNCFMRISVGC